ncbi:MAG: winged helix-turn-helix transcriptional regulator [Zestosphaera sp.]
MMSENIYKKIIEYLKSSPGATPREIADSLGVTIGAVRVALLRLREAGYVVKSVKGRYFAKSGVKDLSMFGESRGSVASHGAREDDVPSTARVVSEPLTRRNMTEADLSQVKNELKDLREAVRVLGERVTKLEEEFNLLMKSLKTEGRPREPKQMAVAEGSIMRVEDAKSRGISVDALVRSGNYVVVKGYVVSQEFLDNFRRKFPITLKDLKDLTREERELLDAMVSEGLAYLHAGREYKLT